MKLVYYKKRIILLMVFFQMILFLILSEVIARNVLKQKLKLNSVFFPPYQPKYYECFGDILELPQKEDNEYRIIMLGGSTAYGFPSSDFEAKLNSYAEDNGLNKQFKFFNLAYLSYQSTQEFIRFYQHVLDAHPDIIITLHGTNDLSTVLHCNNEPGDPIYFDHFREIILNWGMIPEVRFNFILHNMLLRYSYLYRLLTKIIIGGINKDGNIELKVNRVNERPRQKPYNSLVREQIISLYAKNIECMAVLAKHFNIKLLVTLQPMFFGKWTSLSNEEKKVRRYKKYVDANLLYLGEFEEIFSRFSRVLIDYKNKYRYDTFYFEDLSYLFSHTRETIFLDSCHLTGNGNSPIMAIYMRYIISDVTGKDLESIPLYMFDNWTRDIVRKFDIAKKLAY